MIAIESLLYKIDQRLNKLSTQGHQQIPLEDKILVIREAEIKLVKQKLNSTNALSAGFDQGKKRYQDLEFLIEKPEDHPLAVKLKDKRLNRWEADLSKLTPSYMFYVDSYILADKDSCKGQVIWVNKDLTAHADIPTLLNNANYRPSFEYQETFCELSSGTLGFYTDGTFTPTKLYISYLRYPRKVDQVGYEDFQGNASTKVDSELPEYLEDELLDIIVADLALYTENISAYQGQSQNQSQNE
jgi:hypothetical protein